MPNYTQKTALATLLAVSSSTVVGLQNHDNSSATRAAPGAYQSTDRIIVKYKPGYSINLTSALSSSSSHRVNRNDLPANALKPDWQISADIRSAERISSTGAVIYQLNKRADLNSLQAKLEQLQQDPNIEYAEPDLIMQIQRVPNDARYSEQWHYYESKGGMNLPNAWDISTGSPDSVVAVIDTGVLPHDDLRSNLLGGYDFIGDADRARDNDGRDADPTDEGDWAMAGSCGGGYPQWSSPSSWHGTHVAGTIGAVSNNGVGVAGVAWNSKVLPIRALGHCGGYSSDIIDGIRWAAGYNVAEVPDNPTPAKVINLSLGGYGNCTRAYQEAIDDARRQGVTVVVAAGNDNDYASRYSPANCEGVITVAANNRDGGRAYYSNFGRSVDITAPGGETSEETSDNGILSTLNTGSRGANYGEASYGYYQGTSMAAPHVAGVVSLLYSIDSSMTPNRAENLLKATARRFPTGIQRECSKDECGAGIVDATALLKKASGDVSEPEEPKPEDNDSDNGDSDSNTQQQVFENNEWHYIPDNNESGINSRIFVNRSGNAGSITVKVDIAHDYIGDLQVRLVAPNGKSVVLAEPSDDRDTQLKTSWTVEASTVSAYGEWSLEVSDHYRQDTGYLKYWGLEFK